MNTLIEPQEIARIVADFKQRGSNHVNIACEWEDVEKFRKLLVSEGYKYFLPAYETRMVDTKPYATIYFNKKGQL